LNGEREFAIDAIQHSYCPRLLASFADLTTARQQMGHKDIRQTIAYAHVMQRSLDAAATNLESQGQHASQYRKVL